MPEPEKATEYGTEWRVEWTVVDGMRKAMVPAGAIIRFLSIKHVYYDLAPPEEVSFNALHPHR